MALVRNGRSVFQQPGIYRGTTSGQSGNVIKGGLKNRFFGGFDEIFGAYPNGALAPGAFVLPIKPGSMSSYTLASTALAGSAGLIRARPMSGSATLTLTVSNAQLDQIASIIASGSFVLAKADAGLAAAAGMSGSSTFVFAKADAAIGAIFSVTASGALVLSPDADLSALAFMEASAGGPTPLSPEGLATALLDQNDIETGYTLREALRLVLSSLAGKISGAGTSTITIRNVTDDKNRIVATVDSNGNRTSITYDVSD